jgi:AraC family transcriptional regulator
MSMTIKPLASGDGWLVSDYICSAGPADPVFEEQHRSVSIAAVIEGTFRYRTRQGSALMAPGSLLLGNYGACFECGHEHGIGDRCIAFHFEPSFFERIVSAIPSSRRIDFTQARLAPIPATTALIARAELAISNTEWFEEIALDLAGTAVRTMNQVAYAETKTGPSTNRRMAEIVRYLECNYSEAQPIAHLADLAAMSPYHFLREFRRVTGVTPHQYVVSLRLREAARRLRTSDENVASAAIASGFGDISEFNRRFRKTFGMTPQIWRKRGQF